jgi:hypothetical protein
MATGGFDFSQFFQRARSREGPVIAAATRAVDEFGEHLLGQSQQLAPVGGGSHSPYDPAPGTLQASATSTPAELEDNKIVKLIGFNTIYAAVQHEHLDFGHDVGQAKYLEAPMRESSAKFSEFVASRVRPAMEGSD